MKTAKRVLAGLGTACLILPSLAMAQDKDPMLAMAQDKDPMFTTDVGIGGNFMPDIVVKSLGGAKDPVDPGVRSYLDFNWNATRNLSLGFETGNMYNQLNTDFGNPLGGRFQSAYLYQVPLLATVTLKLPLGTHITPYIGGGIGGVSSTLETKTFNTWAWDSDLSWAWQATGGVKVRVWRYIEVGVAYKFTESEDHSWFSGDPFRYTAFGKSYNHSVIATCSFNF